MNLLILLAAELVCILSGLQVSDQCWGYLLVTPPQGSRGFVAASYPGGEQTVKALIPRQAAELVTQMVCNGSLVSGLPAGDSSLKN